MSEKNSSWYFLAQIPDTWLKNLSQSWLSFRQSPGHEIL